MGSLHDLLEDRRRGGQLFKYIHEKWKDKIVSPKTAMRFGTYKIGTRSKQDSNLSFDNKNNEFYALRQEARRGDKEAKSALMANSLLMFEKKKELLSSKFTTKSGKEYNGRFIRHFIVERLISYKDKNTGNTIEYIQKRNTKTGRVVR